MRAALLVLVALLLAGCSGGASSSAPGASAAPSGTVEGVVAVRQPLAGVAPRMLRLDGGSGGVANATDAGGVFLFPGGDYPADFRLLADVPGVGTLVREVRGYAGGRVRVGLVGHLVAAEFAAHPEAGLGAAEARVKAFLGLPPTLPLDGAPWLGERTSAFSDDLFLRQAAAGGGLEAFVALLLQELDGGGTRSFVEEPRKPGDWETFLDKAGGDLTADVPDAFGDFAIGWAVGLMGLNTGKQAALQEVAQDVDALGTQIDDLSLALAEGFADSAFQEAARELEFTTLAPLETSSNRLAANALRYRITDEPFLPDPELQSLTSLVTTFDTNVYLENLTNALLGQAGGSNMLALGIGVLQSRLGITHAGPVATQSGLWSNERIVGPLEALVEFYSSYSALALNLLMEAGTSGPAPGTAIPRVRHRLIQLRAALKAAALQVPPPMPGAPGDVYLADYENGRMWYLRIQYPVKFTDLAPYFDDTGKKFQAAPYGDWLPASEPSGGTNDLATLFARLKAANPSNPPAALATLGFTPGWDPSVTVPADVATLFCYAKLASGGFIESDQQRVMDLETGETSGWPSSGNQAVQMLFVRPFPNTAPAADPQYPGDRDPDAARATGVLTLLETPAAAAADGATTQVTVEGTWTITTPLATLAVPNLDATARVVWTSADPETAEVSNATGTEGLVTWYRKADGSMPDPVAITASSTVTVDSAGNVTPAGVQATLIVNPPASLPERTLTALSVSPRNVTYLISNTTQQYYATAWWSDGRVTDETATAVWTVVGAPSGAFFESSNPGVLALKPWLTQSNLQLEAAFGGLTRTVKALVLVD